MENAFEILGVPERLVLDAAELTAAFRAAGAKVHPDAGGEDADFARLRKAQESLESPSRRLRHWLELRGVDVEPRGAVDDALMDLFALVGGVTQRADAMVRKRTSTRSALALAMSEAAAQECREEIENAVTRVEEAIHQTTAGFAELESAIKIDKTRVAPMVRNLAFLEKWKLSLRSAYARLV